MPICEIREGKDTKKSLRQSEKSITLIFTVKSKQSLKATREKRKGMGKDARKKEELRSPSFPFNLNLNYEKI